uniref:Methyltranfer_dom domain-containing protein n=1 Tax=Haemonchus contortus TaxID=6289 RepID=A0A7I4YSS9_HAECO
MYHHTNRFKVGSKQKAIKSLICLCVIFCISLVILVAYRYTKDSDSCKDLDGRRRIVIDRMCPENSKPCQNVYLGAMSLGEKKKVFLRLLVSDDRTEGAETAVVLRSPGGEQETSEKFRCTNIQKWPVDHDTIIVSHEAAILAATFLMPSLSLEETGKGKQILEIGLGGGNYDMRLHKMKPYANITAVEIDPIVVKMAYKWFGVVDSEFHHTVVQDGKVFLEQAYNQGRKFDIVVIDACGSYSSPLLCPADPFQDAIILGKIKKMLTKSGTLIVDLLSEDYTEIGNYVWKKFLQMLKSLFPVCVMMNIRDRDNIVVTCTTMSMSNISDLAIHFDNRLATIISTLRLNHVLDVAYTTILHAK